MSAQFPSGTTPGAGSYVTGFALSLALTTIAFGVASTRALPGMVVLPIIAVLAVIQLGVQLRYFLHMGALPGQRGRLAIFIFTIFVLAVVVAGSLWVMHNANINMMPTTMTPTHARMGD